MYDMVQIGGTTTYTLVREYDVGEEIVAPLASLYQTCAFAANPNGIASVWTKSPIHVGSVLASGIPSHWYSEEWAGSMTVEM